MADDEVTVPQRPMPARATGEEAEEGSPLNDPIPKFDAIPEPTAKQREIAARLAARESKVASGFQPGDVIVEYKVIRETLWQGEPPNRFIVLTFEDGSKRVCRPDDEVATS